MSKKLLALATIAVLTGSVSAVKAEESLAILDSVPGAQQHVLSNEEMAKIAATWYITVIPGDTLSYLAALNNQGNWTSIYYDPYGNYYNMSVIGSNPNLIYPGQVLWLKD